MMSESIYTSTKQPQPGERDENGLPRLPYLPDDGLVEAVNLALLLERPLLIQGEPGCGKTRLASAVAYELGWPCKEWYVKSTSRARDGLYVFDSIGRLRDAQLAAQGLQQEREKSRNPGNYVTLGPFTWESNLYCCLHCSTHLTATCVVASPPFRMDAPLSLGNACKTMMLDMHKLVW